MNNGDTILQGVTPKKVSACLLLLFMTRNVREHAFGHVRPANIQISLRIRASLGAF